MKIDTIYTVLQGGQIAAIEMGESAYTTLEEAQRNSSMYQWEVGAFYRWNSERCAYIEGGQGKRNGALECVYIDQSQVVLRNKTGLHLCAKEHLRTGYIYRLGVESYV